MLLIHPLTPLDLYFLRSANSQAIELKINMKVSGQTIKKIQQMISRKEPCLFKKSHKTESNAFRYIISEDFFFEKCISFLTLYLAKAKKLKSAGLWGLPVLIFIHKTTYHGTVFLIKNMQ